MLELTTRFSGITTAKRGNGQQLSAKMAADHAKANFRYIIRHSATQSSDLIALNFISGFTGNTVDRKALRKLVSEDIEKRARCGGTKGIRVAEKIMFSLPNEMRGEPAREAVRLIAQRMAGGSPNVKIVAAIHTDRPNNLHVHMLVLDGLETKDMAKRNAAPNAQRIRPRYILRMGDRGRPKEMRKLIATTINEVADLHGVGNVEHRSYRDRGITKNAQKHDGPHKRARLDKLHGGKVLSDGWQSLSKLNHGPKDIPIHRTEDDPLDAFRDLFEMSARTLKQVHRGASR